MNYRKLENIEEIKQALKFETATKEEKDYGQILSKIPRNNMIGNCERNCPFGVKIIKRMEETEEIFDY